MAGRPGAVMGRHRTPDQPPRMMAGWRRDALPAVPYGFGALGLAGFAVKMCGWPPVGERGARHWVWAVLLFAAAVGYAVMAVRCFSEQRQRTRDMTGQATARDLLTDPDDDD